MAKPLLDLLKKESFFKWKNEHRAFEDMKEKLFSTLVLKFLNFTKIFKVHTMQMTSLLKGSSCKDI
jgi:hypothetical protein